MQLQPVGRSVGFSSAARTEEKIIMEYKNSVRGRGKQLLRHPIVTSHRALKTQRVILICHCVTRRSSRQSEYRTKGPKPKGRMRVGYILYYADARARERWKNLGIRRRARALAPFGNSHLLSQKRRADLKSH
jgi:hypothetical protein